MHPNSLPVLASSAARTTSSDKTPRASCTKLEEEKKKENSKLKLGGVHIFSSESHWVSKRISVTSTRMPYCLWPQSPAVGNRGRTDTPDGWRLNLYCLLSLTSLPCEFNAFDYEPVSSFSSNDLRRGREGDWKRESEADGAYWLSRHTRCGQKLVLQFPFIPRIADSKDTNK